MAVLEGVRTRVVVVVVAVARELLFFVTSAICVRTGGRGSEVTLTYSLPLSFRFSSAAAFSPEWIRSTISLFTFVM